MKILISKVSHTRNLIQTINILLLTNQASKQNLLCRKALEILHRWYLHIRIRICSLSQLTLKLMLSSLSIATWSQRNHLLLQWKPVWTWSREVSKQWIIQVLIDYLCKQTDDNPHFNLCQLKYHLLTTVNPKWTWSGFFFWHQVATAIQLRQGISSNPKTQGQVI